MTPVMAAMMTVAAVPEMATAMAAVVAIETAVAAVVAMATAMAVMVIAMAAVAAMATAMATGMEAVTAMAAVMVVATTAQQSTKRRQRGRQQMRTQWRVGGSSLYKTVEVFTKKKLSIC